MAILTASGFLKMIDEVCGAGERQESGSWRPWQSEGAHDSTVPGKLSNLRRR